jgi:hypothetical protein
LLQHAVLSLQAPCASLIGLHVARLGRADSTMQLLLHIRAIAWLSWALWSNQGDMHHK